MDKKRSDKAPKNLDELMAKLGRFNETYQRFQAAKSKTVPGQVNEATVGDLKQILEDYEQFLRDDTPELSFFIHDVRQRIAETKKCIAHAYYLLHNFDQVEYYYEGAAQAYEEIGQQMNANDCRAIILETKLSDEGNVDSEIERLQATLETLPKHSLQHTESMIALGELYALEGDSFEAENLLKIAKSELEEMGHKDIGEGILRLTDIFDSSPGASPYPSLGRTQIPQEMLTGQRAMNLYKRIYQVSTTLRGMRKGVEDFEELTKRMDSDQLRQKLSQELKALSDYQKKLSELETVGFEDTLSRDARAVIKRMDKWETEGRVDHEPILYDKEEPSSRVLIPTPVDTKATLLMQKAAILIRLQRINEAIDALLEARRVLGNRQQRTMQVLILGMLAPAYARRQDWQALSATCDEGIKLAERYRYKVTSQYLQSTYLRFRASLYSMGAGAAYKLGNHELMLERAELSKSRSVLRYQRRTPTSPTNPERTEREFQSVCEEIDSVREQGAIPKELLIKRRTLWDLLFIQRYQVKTGDTLPQFSLDAVQSVLEADEAIIYYYWLEKQTLLIVTIDKEHVIPEVRFIPLEARAEMEKFAQDVLHFSKGNMSSLDQVQDFSPLLLPAEAMSLLREKQRLLFSPHHFLHAIPFHALMWDNRLLIQRFAATYIPNLTSLLLCYFPSTTQETLALGIRDYEVPGYPLGPLPKAEEEVEQLEQIYKGRSIPITILKGSQASENRLRQLEKEGKLGKFACLHFATHGENVNADTPMESNLFLQDSILDGLEIANWKLNAEVVVLSACCSGQRAISGRGVEEVPGDELFGLQAAFFAAGVRRVLGALWPVDSKAALLITTGFHRYLADGQLPELALQKAVDDYLKKAGILTRKVYYWAPFFLSAMGRSSSRN